MGSTTLSMFCAFFNIAALKEKGIHYIKKDREDKWQRQVLGTASDEIGALEDYLLNFCCDGNGLKASQNQFSVFQKAEMISIGGVELCQISKAITVYCLNS